MASLYLSVNKIFADKVISPDDDFVCVHVYHLMVLPTFLRKRFNRVNLRFFLDIPFPSSEIYRPLPIVKPARGRGKDVQEVQSETETTVKRINEMFGRPVQVGEANASRAIRKYVAHWARSFIQNLERACGGLSEEEVLGDRTKNRAILVDYYGIMVQPGSIRTTSSNETIQTLKSLFSDPKNIVFLVSGKDRKTLTEWFSSCDDLGLAAVAEIFACTVGQKPRKAKYYLDESAEIVKMLEGLATSTAAISDQTASTTDVPTKIL
ncbi:hypothetical protein F2Q69_00033373 [Brassica cretica]|uniref:Trehalose-6-phosphate synthase n=1 Tax=Brassica cretica TaxID=69181 RepID=A0A8S9SKG6_BRACR|nr:hypothetical protein F2Q69_00033373 [Brassica cretica]